MSQYLVASPMIFSICLQHKLLVITDVSYSFRIAAPLLLTLMHVYYCLLKPLVRY